MSACTARPVYGVAELLGLVVSILRPWLDAIRTEFARPTPGVPAPTPVPVPLPQTEPAPQVEPMASPEPVADIPVVVEVVPAMAVEPVAHLPAVAVMAEAAPAVEAPSIWEPEPTADEPLYVKRGTGRGARYAPAGPGDRGPKFRKKMIGTTRVSYVRA